MAWAQPQKKEHFDMNEFKARLEKYINKAAHLTPEESQKFFPLYYEMKDKQHQMQMEMFKLKREKMKVIFNRMPGSADKKFESLSDEEYAKAILRIKKLNLSIAELEADYYKKMCKVIPAKKVFIVMQAEDDYHRKMLSKFNQERIRK